MRLSTGYFELELEGRSSLHDCPKDVHATAGKSEDGLVMTFASAPFAAMEGAAAWLAEREGGLVEYAFDLLAAGSASDEARFAGLADDGCDSDCGRERVDEIAAAADQQPDLEIDLGGGFDGAQVGPHAHLIGGGAGVARIGLVLAPDGALPHSVDSQARHMDQREAGFGPHGLGESVDAAHDVDAALTKARRAAHAVVALHSDQLQSLLSCRGCLALPGDLPPEPFDAASMKTIPAAPPNRMPDTPQVLPKSAVRIASTG